MDELELGRILGDHDARIAHLERAHEDQAEILEEHEAETERVEEHTESAFNVAVHATDDAVAIAERGVQDAVQEAVQAAVVVAEAVAADVAEEVAEENEGDEGNGVTEIVEGESKPEPETKSETKETVTPRKRHKPFGRS